MDVLSWMLTAHRGQDAFVLSCELDAPWSIQIADRANVSLVVLISGTCVVTRDPDVNVTLRVGDVAVLRGPRPYLLADQADRRPGVVVEPGQVCRTLDPAMGIRWLGGRSWGNSPGGPSAFLAATYEMPGQIRGRLVEAMPELAVLPAPACDPALVAALTAELERDQPGRDVMVDRYVDLLLGSAVRAWFGRPEVTPPAWWSAQSDPVVSRVLSLIHDRPGEAWTLQGLAAQVGYSRAGLSRRFTAKVGESPMNYLTSWRMTVAAEMLQTGTDSVEVIGRAVGYANPFAFSTAFKRVHDRSPRAFRAAG